MAGTTVTRRSTGMPHSDVAELVTQVNAIVTDLATIHSVLAEQCNGFPTTAPTLAIGSTSAAKIANAAFTVQIAGGTAISVAAAETAFTATTHDVADTKFAYFTLSVQQDGSTITITKGADAASAAAAVRPPAPVDEVYMGTLLLENASGALFDATTTLLTATGITCTFTDATVFASADLTAAQITAV